MDGRTHSGRDGRRAFFGVAFLTVVLALYFLVGAVYVLISALV